LSKKMTPFHILNAQAKNPGPATECLQQQSTCAYCQRQATSSN